MNYTKREAYTAYNLLITVITASLQKLSNE
jgi:hypothetical protein